MNMQEELEKAAIKARKLNIKAFKVVVLAENNKIYKLTGNAHELAAQNFTDFANAARKARPSNALNTFAEWWRMEVKKC